MFSKCLGKLAWWFIGADLNCQSMKGEVGGRVSVRSQVDEGLGEGWKVKDFERQQNYLIHLSKISV